MPPENALNKLLRTATKKIVGCPLSGPIITKAAYSCQPFNINDCIIKEDKCISSPFNVKEQIAATLLLSYFETSKSTTKPTK